MEKKDGRNVKRLIGSAIVLAAALLLCGPAENLLDQLTTAFDWTVPENSEWMFYGCNTNHVTLKNKLRPRAFDGIRHRFQIY